MASQNHMQEERALDQLSLSPLIGLKPKCAVRREHGMKGNYRAILATCRGGFLSLHHDYL
jgi:hypothetical protein